MGFEVIDKPGERRRDSWTGEKMADAKLLFFPRKAEKEGGNVAENCDREGRGEKSGPRRDISRRTELTDDQETGQEAKKDGARARTGRGKGERQARQRGKGRQRKKESRPKQRLALDGFVGTMGLEPMTSAM
jgi:hypothetical protein